MEPSTNTPNTGVANPVVTGIIVVLTLIVVAVVLVRTYPPAGKVAQNAYTPVAATVQTAWTLVSLPSDLRKATFGTEKGSSRVSGLSLVPAEDALAPEVQTVYNYPFNVESKKENGRVSPGKERVVFQQLVDSQNADNSSGWQVNVAGVKNSYQMSLGKGVQPFFVDETHVAHFTSAGLVVTDVATDGFASTTLISQPFTDARAVAVSPNQSVVAFYNAETERIEAHSVVGESVLVTSYGGSYTSIALSDGALYILSVTPTGTTVTRQAFEENATAKVIATFPASLGITTLSF